MFSAECLSALQSASFTPLLPPQIKAQRSVQLFGVDSEIRKRSTGDIVAEICHHNAFAEGNIDFIKFPLRPIIKLIFRGTAAAYKALERGVLMYNMLIPPWRVQKEDYVPVITCLRCNSEAQHTSQNCPKPRTYTVCSECSEEGHRHNACQAAVKMCLNCGGGGGQDSLLHLSERRKAVGTARAEKAARPKTYSAAAAPAIATVPASVPAPAPQLSSTRPSQMWI